MKLLKMDYVAATCPEWLAKLLRKDKEKFSWISRLLVEEQFLKTKIYHLENFLKETPQSQIEESFGKTYYKLLVRQHKIMNSYLKVLKKRIEIVENTFKNRLKGSSEK